MRKREEKLLELQQQERLGTTVGVSLDGECDSEPPSSAQAHRGRVPPQPFTQEGK